jgi:hypothetical protein
MSYREKYRLKSGESKLNINEDIYTNIDLTNIIREIPTGEINHVVNISDLFNNERQTSTKYRISGTIIPIFSNPLMNISGNKGLGKQGESNIPDDGNGLDTLNDKIFLEDPYDNNFIGGETLTYSQSIQNFLIEKDGWFGFNDPDIFKTSQCKFFELEPTRKKFDLNTNKYNNWTLTITYPKENDYEHLLIKNGILVTELRKTNVGGIDMLLVITAIKHNLVIGDNVRLSDFSDTILNRDIEIVKLGLNNGDLMDNSFVINLDPNIISLGPINARMKRLVNGEESNYYVRKFEKLLPNNDFEMYPLAFSKNIYGDQIYQFTINQDINLFEITDNLGKPVSELYLTLIKTNSNGTFGKIKSGFDLEYLEGNINLDVSNVRRIHDGESGDIIQFESQTPLENDILINNNLFYGDIVEYNRYELFETVLSNVLHRFNTLDREKPWDTLAAKGPRREGYLYNPHNLIRVKDFSLYVEQGDNTTDGIPDYAEDLGDGRIIWRDLLDIDNTNGLNGGVNYPFTNGCHYLYDNYCFKTFRQDPFGQYDLYYQGNTLDEESYDPSDPRGKPITDKYKIRGNSNEC